MDTYSLFPLEALIREIVVDTNDEEFRSGFTRGWYTSRVQEALEELSFDTFYNLQTHDELNWNINSDCKYPLPKGCFNMRELYLFEGDCCTIDNQVPVVWKRLYNSSNKTTGSTSLISDSPSTDNPIYQSASSPSNLYYANVVDGVINFSPNCANYPNLRIVFNGVGVNYGDTIKIPIFLRRPVRDYVVERFFFAMKARDPRQRAQWVDADLKLNGSRGRKGSWKKAENLIKSMSTFERESLMNYLSRPNI